MRYVAAADLDHKEKHTTEATSDATVVPLPGYQKPVAMRGANAAYRELQL